MIKYIKYLYTLRYVKLFSYILAKWLQTKMQKDLMVELKKCINIISKLESKIKNLQNKINIYKSKIQLLNIDIENEKYLNHKYKYLYFYGFQIAIGAINKGLLLLLAGLIFGILSQIVVATVSFMCLRVFIGGLHFDSYTKCSYISLASLVILGLLAKYIPYNSIINLIIFSTLFCIALIFAPIEHKNRSLNNKQKIRFKCISLILLCALYIVQTFINDVNMNNCIMYGVSLAGIIALPIFKKIN